MSDLLFTSSPSVVYLLQTREHGTIRYMAVAMGGLEAMVATILGRREEILGVRQIFGSEAEEILSDLKFAREAEARRLEHGFDEWDEDHMADSWGKLQEMAEQIFAS